MCVALSKIWYQNKIWFLTCIINLLWFGYEIKARRLVWQQMASLKGGEPFRKQNLVERNSSLWAFSWAFALFHTSLFSTTLFLHVALSLLWSKTLHFATFYLPLSSASSCAQKQQPLCAQLWNQKTLLFLYCFVRSYTEIENWITYVLYCKVLLVNFFST